MGLLALVPARVWIALGLAAAFAGAVFYVDHRGYTRGAASVQVKWDADVNARNAVALEKAKKESAYLAQIGEAHVQELSDLEAQRARDVDAVRAGFRLRLAGSCAATASPAPAPVSNDPPRCELSGEVTSALQSIAIDADRNTLQLSACQAVISSYLKEFP